MTIRLEVSDQVAELRLDRPSARNALRSRDWQDLADLVIEIGASDARVAILSGVGSAFCAGADLDELSELAFDQSARAPFRIAMRQGLDAVSASLVPVIAMIHGDCHGAGVALAMACDFRIAAPAARFSLPPARFGILYPQEDVDRLVSLVGPGQASRLLLSGGVFDCEEALRIRLADVGAEAATAYAAAIAANDPLSVALLRKQVAGLPVAAAADLFEASFGSPAFRETAEGLRRRRAAARRQAAGSS